MAPHGYQVVRFLGFVHPRYDVKPSLRTDPRIPRSITYLVAGETPLHGQCGCQLKVKVQTKCQSWVQWYFLENLDFHGEYLVQ